MKVLFFLPALLCGGNLGVFAVNDTASSGVVFCYYCPWAIGRPGAGCFGISDLPPNLCTHIIYTFLTLDSSGNLKYPAEQKVEGKSNYVADLIALKKTNPDLKILAGIGGAMEGSQHFTTVVNDDTLRATFVKKLFSYLNEKGFDGLDLDWEYPAQNGGASSDKEKFVTLIKEFKEAFAPKKYLLTAAVAITQDKIDSSYNVPELNEHLDYINLMLYDFHGGWESVTGVNAPLYAQESDGPNLNLNANHSVHTWINSGASPTKLVMGLAAYGKTFTLASQDSAKTGAPVTRVGVPGPYTTEAGMWGYNEICVDQKKNTAAWKTSEVSGNYAYANKDLFWVGYDNPNTIFAKGQYAKQMGLAGIMCWAVDMDEFSGLCGNKYPLISQGIAGYNSIKFIQITGVTTK